MILYLFIIIVALVLASKNNYRAMWSANLNVSYKFLFVSLVLVAGLRYMNGGDTHNYYDAFLDSPELSSLTKSTFDDSRYQAGYVIFLAFCKSISNNFVVVQLFEAIFLNAIIFFFIKRESKTPFLAIALYFLLNYFELNMEVMREGLAVAFGLLYYIALNNKKYLWCIIWFLLAYSMHVSALILLVFPLVNGIKFSWVGFLLVSFLIIGVPFVYLTVPNIDLYAAIIFQQEEWVTNNYIQQEFDSSLNVNFYVQHIVIWFVLPMFSVYYLSKHGEEKYTGYIYAFVALHLLAMISYAFYRFANYCAPFWWIVLALTIHKVFEIHRIRNRILSLICVTIVLFFLYQNSQFLYDSDTKKYFYERYIPYNSVIFDKSYS